MKTLEDDKSSKIISTSIYTGLVAPSKENLLKPKFDEDPNSSYKRCTHCGYCRHVCKVYNISWCETDYAGGRIRIIKALNNKKIELDDKQIVPTLFRCMLCGQCKVVCPVGIDTIKVFTDFRRWANRQGVTHPPLESIKQSILDNSNPYMESHSLRHNWCKNSKLGKDILERSHNYSHKDNQTNPLERIEDYQDASVEDSEPIRVGYFPGCASAYRNKELADSTIKVLTKLGVEIILFPEEKCCGAVLLRTGLVDEAIELLEHNLKVFREKGVKDIVFSCSCCFSTFKNDYPHILNQEIGVNFYHLTEYVLKVINKGGYKIKYDSTWNKVPLKVTYHDSCHLGRYSGIYEEPRDVLKKIEGLLLIEMKYNREMSECCGAGGGVKALYGELSEKIGGFEFQETRHCMTKMRENGLKKAIKTQADILVTSCVFCRNNFYVAAMGSEVPIKVRDFSQILENCTFNK